MSDEALNNEVVVTTPESENTAVSEAANTDAPGEVETPKTFTQEELDKAVGKRLAIEQRKWQREQAQAAESQRQAPSAPPQPDQFQDLESYAQALGNFKAETIIAEREARKQQVTVESTYAEREESARDRYSDFQQVVYRDPVDGGPSITDYMAATIKESDNGPEIAYYLGKNIDESKRICRLSPLAQARELGKIEASLTTKAVKKASSAPEPITPVGSRSSSPSYDVTDPRSAKVLTSSEWIDARNRKLRTQG